VAVEFRILGDVEARSQGRRLDIGHARQRCVLACLLVDVNRPVSADQLVDRMWADNPPHRSRNALAAYVSRLRQLLADDADVELAHGPGGYTLTADPRSVDLHMFREMLSQARAAADPADSAALFDRALDLWRGEPFSTLDTPWTNEVRTSLEAERLSAELDRNDAALEAGRHTDLLGGLAATLQAHPLDERVAGQLMLAQYRSGRQADALETYQRRCRRPSPRVTRSGKAVPADRGAGVVGAGPCRHRTYRNTGSGPGPLRLAPVRLSGLTRGFHNY
jgi:DNA-binding SARP family transcriptional activator